MIKLNFEFLRAVTPARRPPQSKNYAINKFRRKTIVCLIGLQLVFQYVSNDHPSWTDIAKVLNIVNC